MRAIGAEAGGGGVRLEPELEAIAAGLDAGGCDDLARLFYRWSKQLWTKSAILQRQGAPMDTGADRPPGEMRPEVAASLKLCARVAKGSVGAVVLPARFGSRLGAVRVA